FLGDGVAKGVCHGDSGGPSFHTFSDGVERVVGVHSFTTDQACLTGADTRVDAYQTFIRQWLTEKEAPSCGDDGRCAMNCPQVDLDCVCGGDGQCTAACPELARDPDCPATCGAEGTCTQGCPVKDPDCTPEGESCANPGQCGGGKCISDPQHDPYCSVACTTSAECFTGTACNTALGQCEYTQLPVTPFGAACVKGQTFCDQFSACTGPSAADLTCTWRCTTTADCQPGATCQQGIDGLYCHVPRPPIVLAAVGTVENTAAACSSGVGLLPALGLLLFCRRRLRRS
ncbi:MAG: hypothetical protein JNK82_01965, partial [Myxococcaceae bacterium]|nr:hypothetical protein [Myxococcaceae bacterium]